LIAALGVLAATVGYAPALALRAKAIANPPYELLR
jgi:hypothetical protein